jgi:uncharacterized membrane protein YdjX (TVP38/TMEM64 family)
VPIVLQLTGWKIDQQKIEAHYMILIRKYRRTLIIWALIFVVIGVIRYLNQYDYLTIASLKNNSLHFREYVEQHYISAVLIYCLSYFCLIMVGVPATPIMTLLGGYLFGAIPGMFYALVSATFGIMITFLVIRYFLANMLSARYQHQLDKFKEKIQQYGYTYLISLHLLMVIPYFIISTLAALAEIPVTTFAWTAFVGSAPLLGIYAFAGKNLANINSVKDIFSPGIIIALLLLALLIAIPTLVKRWHKPDLQ